MIYLQQKLIGPCWKAHMFNGINLPKIYSINENNGIILKKELSYEDFLGRWRALVNETV